MPVGQSLLQHYVIASHPGPAGGVVSHCAALQVELLDQSGGPSEQERRYSSGHGWSVALLGQEGRWQHHLACLQLGLALRIRAGQLGVCRLLVVA